MKGIIGFQKITRVLYQASGILIFAIAASSGMHDRVEAIWTTYLLAGIYGLYLYYHAKGGKPTSMQYFAAEVVLILLLDWFATSPFIIYLFPLLIIRRAADTACEAAIYLEAGFVGVLYLVIRMLHAPQIAYPAWLYVINDMFMLGFTVIIAQMVLHLSKSLQADKEKLRLKLDKVEASYQKAAELAMRDGLTGLYNYRALQEHISGIGDAGFAILLIDVDHFKDFNDRYGHLVGDQVLVQIGQVILENVRRSDRVYRYGGEEFAVVLEETDDEVALFTAERIRLRVAGQAIKRGGQQLKSVTISSGVAVFKGSKITSHQVLEQADKALYEAKAKGRNNVVFFIEPQLSLH